MKHGWNSFEKYFRIHDTILCQYHRSMAEPKFYRVKEYTSQWIRISCEKILVKTKRGNTIRADITKDVEIDDSVPNRRRARTLTYTYSANIPGGDKLFRYCGPHFDIDPDEAPDHHKFHHKHDFTSGKENIVKLASDKWPHVNEFLDEIINGF